MLASPRSSLTGLPGSVALCHGSRSSAVPSTCLVAPVWRTTAVPRATEVLLAAPANRHPTAIGRLGGGISTGYSSHSPPACASLSDGHSPQSCTCFLLRGIEKWSGSLGGSVLSGSGGPVHITSCTNGISHCRRSGPSKTAPQPFSRSSSVRHILQVYTTD